MEIDETNEQAVCIAAPVLDAPGGVVAAPSSVGPEQRLKTPDLAVLLAAVLRKSTPPCHAPCPACRADPAGPSPAPSLIAA